MNKILFLSFFLILSSCKQKQSPVDTIAMEESKENIYAQDIVGKNWRINKIIGQDLKNAQEFILTRIDTNNNDNFIYGNSIMFDKDNSFNAMYAADCGNDCFPSSTGTFKLIGEKHIRLFIKEFRQDGDCENKQLELNTDLGIYSISKETDQTIKFIKISD